jgi:hypothetical protein
MKENVKNRAIIAEVIARAWREPAYMSQLRQNPKRVLEQAGASIPPTMDVVMLENTPTLINVILPPRAQTSKYEARMQAAAQLLKELPEDMEVHLHRDSDVRAFIVVPEAPAKGGELSDKQLEAVVGGKGSSHKPAPPPPPGPPQIVVAGSQLDVAAVLGGPAQILISGGGPPEIAVAVVAGMGEPVSIVVGAVIY